MRGNIYTEEMIEWLRQNVAVRTWPENTRKECLIFLDGNRNNLDILNLMKIKRSENLILGRMGLWQKDAELNQAAVNIAKVIEKIGDRKKCKKIHAEVMK